MTRVVLLLVLAAAAPGWALHPVNYYTVTVTQPAHGTITPEGVVTIPNCEAVPEDPCEFAITPDAGYSVADVQSSGVSYGPMATFKFYGLWQNVALAATMFPTPNGTAENLYVDNLLGADIEDGTYSVAGRSGGGSDGNAYRRIGSACYRAGPGDTVYLRAGTYTYFPGTGGNTYTNGSDVVWPRTAGTALAPITIRNYGTEAVVIGTTGHDDPSDTGESICRAMISMRNMSYITVQGLTIRDCAGWAWIGYSDHITVQNCTFRASGSGSKGCFRWLYSSYCVLNNCTFADSDYDGVLIMNSDHCVVTNCTFKGFYLHSCLSLRSASWCVFRGDSFRNGKWTSDGDGEKLVEMFDQKMDVFNPNIVSTSYNPPLYNGTQHNLFENCRFGYHPDYSAYWKYGTAEAWRPDSPQPWSKVHTGSRCSALQFSGQHTIIRRNVFSNAQFVPRDPNTRSLTSVPHLPYQPWVTDQGYAAGVALNWRWGGSGGTWSWTGNTLTTGSAQAHEAGYVWGNRVYHNVFYGNDMGQMTFPVDNSTTGNPDPPYTRNCADYASYRYPLAFRFDDNLLVNNTLSGGAMGSHYSGTALNSLTTADPFGIADSNRPVQVRISGRVAQTFWQTNNFYGTAGNPHPDELISDQASYPYQISKTPAFMNTNRAATWTGNVQIDPCFVSLPSASVEASGDFHLRAASDLIDAGAFLTTITTATGKGTTFTVADPNYFYDGYGISGETGDTIKTSAGQTATITDMDYVTGAVTVNAEISWTQGDGIALAYNGSAPDIGAYEFDSADTAPDAATAPTPANAAPNQPTVLTLAWTAGADAAYAEIYLDTTAAWDGTELLGTTTGPSISSGQLAAETEYTWKVVLGNGAGETAGPLWTFTTEPPPLPAPDQVVITAPADDATGVVLVPTLTWQPADGATGYSVYCNTTGTFGVGDRVVNNQAVCAYTPGSPWAANTVYYWRVDALNGSGTTTGATNSFTTLTPSTKTSLTAPADRASKVRTGLTLSWSAVGGAARYRVYLGKSSAFDLDRPYASVTGTTLAVTGLEFGVLYCWKVLAVNSSGAYLTECDTRTFRTKKGFFLAF